MNTHRSAKAGMTNQHGFTLVEMMVAITIGLVLLAGISGIFVNSNKSYTNRDAQSQLQENGRFANYLLAHDLRMAGYFGCNSRVTAPNNLVSGGNALIATPTDKTATNLSVTNGIEGAEYSQLPIQLTASTSDNIATSGVYSGPTGTPAPPAPAVIVVRGGSPAGTQLAVGLASSNAAIVAPTPADTPTTNTLMVISDCAFSDIFAATAVSVSGGNVTLSHGAALNTTTTLARAYRVGAEVTAMQVNAYYIKLDPANSNAPTLYRKRLSGLTVVEEPLIPDVENMQIQYGEDTDADGSANRYVRAGTAGLDMSRVVAIRIWLVVRSHDDNVVPTAQTYSIDGTSYTPTDKRMRRVFTDTIRLRSRSL